MPVIAAATTGRAGPRRLNSGLRWTVNWDESRRLFEAWPPDGLATDGVPLSEGVRPPVGQPIRPGARERSR